jgi:hypothetical protein
MGARQRERHLDRPYGHGLEFRIRRYLQCEAYVACRIVGVLVHGEDEHGHRLQPHSRFAGQCHRDRPSPDTDPDAEAHPHADPKADTNSDPEADPEANTEADPQAGRHPEAHAQAHGQTNGQADREAHCNAH